LPGTGFLQGLGRRRLSEHPSLEIKPGQTLIRRDRTVEEPGSNPDEKSVDTSAPQKPGLLVEVSAMAGAQTRSRFPPLFQREGLEVT